MAKEHKRSFQFLLAATILVLIGVALFATQDAYAPSNATVSINETQVLQAK